MSTLYVTQQGAVISKESERLKVTLEKELLLDVPLRKISQVVIFGRVLVTPPAVSVLLDQGIDLCYLTQHGKYLGRLQPEWSKNAPLRVEQYKAMLDPARGLALARGFVLGKLANLRMTLVRKGPSNAKTERRKAVWQIKAAMKGARQAATLDEVRGREGEGSAAYFAVFRHLLLSDEFTFTTRARRPPPDPVNALLSFGYTLLLNDVCAAVNVVGFDPYIGYLHALEYGRPSLPLDLMEEFRPMVVDTMVTACINQHLLTRADFHETEEGAWRLTDAGRRTFLQQYEARRQTTIVHPYLRQAMTYQQSFEQQARLLAKTLQGEVDGYPPLIMK